MQTAVANDHVYVKAVGVAATGRDRAREFIRDTSALISLPEVCLKLRETLDNPSHTQKDVAEIIVCDPALTVRLLRIVNSAYYGLSRSVDNINHALGILGEEELNNLVIVTSIINTMSAFGDRATLNLFWRSSMFSAVLANALAGEYVSSREDAQEIFISGLLLDIGKMMIYHREPELMTRVKTAMADSGRPDVEIEQDILGFDHSTVGAAMAEAWHFTPEMTANIATHHDGKPESRPWDQAIMFIASYYSDRLDFSNAKDVNFEDMPFPHPVVLQKLGLEENTFPGLLERSFADYLLAFELFCGDAS